jgi:hypothetical protein
MRGSTSMKEHLAFLAIVHTHIVKALVTTTNTDSLTHIAASHRQSILFWCGMKYEITTFTGIEQGIKLGAQSHYAIAPWTFYFIGDYFLHFWCLFKVSCCHVAQLRTPCYNRAGTLGGGGLFSKADDGKFLKLTSQTLLCQRSVFWVRPSYQRLLRFP